jgi:hypothetical protein
MANFAMITSGGLVSVTEASTNGTLIDIRYCLPVYDWRIDPFISPISQHTSATEISSVTNAADTSPYGEIIWNTNTGTYDLSNTNSICLISGSNTVFQNNPDLDIVLNPIQLQHQPINLYNGSPLSNSISASSVVFTPSAANISWIVRGGNVIGGVNGRPAGTNADFWGVVEYSSILGETGRSRASFKCKFAKDVGQFKFNKIALYAVKLDLNYQPYGDPFLFAQVIMPEPQIKSSIDDGGLSEFVLDFQIELTTLDVAWEDVVYGSQNDYWERITQDGSLHTGCGTYIGKYAPNETNNRVAKAVISTWQNLGYNENDDLREMSLPQMALTMVSEEVVGLNNVKTAHYARFRVDTSGNLNLSLSASNGVFNSIYLETDYVQHLNTAFVPEVSDRYFLGSHYKRFKTIFLGRDGKSLHNETEYNGDPANDLLAIDIHGGGIQLGRSADRSDMTYGLRMVDRSIKMKDWFFENSHILGADLKRDDDESLVITTMSPAADYVTTSASSSGANVMILSGLLQDKMNELFYDTQCVHNDICNLIQTSGTEIDIDYYFKDSRMYLYAKSGIHSLSSIKMKHNSIGNHSNFALLNSFDHFNNGKSSNFVIATNTKIGFKDSDIFTSLESDSTANLYPFLSDNGILTLLAGKEIDFWGDMVAIQTGEDGGTVNISPKTVDFTRHGFVIRKLLDIESCNGTFNNIRFWSYYEQPFARYTNLYLGGVYEFDVVGTISQNVTLASNSGVIESIFKYFKWSRVGNLIYLKFYLDLNMDIQTNSAIKVSFKMPKFTGMSGTDDYVFDGSDAYLTMEVEGTDASMFAEQNGVSEVAGAVRPKIYHPVELVFSKDFDKNGLSDPSEKENTIIVPAYSSLNALGRPNNQNQYGSVVYGNPFTSYAIRFSVSKSGSLIDLTAFQSYLTNYPNGGNVTQFNGIKSVLDFLIAAQAKSDVDRTSEERNSLSQFDFGFYTWNSFKRDVLENNGLSYNLDNFIGNTFDKKSGVRLEYNTSIYQSTGQMSSNDCFLHDYTPEFKTTISNNTNFIIKIKSGEFGATEDVYLRLSTNNANPFIYNVSTSQSNTFIGTTHVTMPSGGGFVITSSHHTPMLKMHDFKLGTRKCLTFGAQGYAYGMYGQEIANTLYNTNSWTD